MTTATNRTGSYFRIRDNKLFIARDGQSAITLKRNVTREEITAVIGHIHSGAPNRRLQILAALTIANLV